MLDDVRSVYEQMKRGNDQVPLQSMATASASKGHADVFRYCLQEGAVIDPDVDHASGMSDNLDMLKVLFEADWRKAKSDQNARDKLLVSSLNNGRQQVAFLLDQGARIQPEAFVRASFNPPSGADVSTVALLLSRGGQPKDSGALQLAAGRGRLDVVEVLLNAGADIDEIPANAPGDVMEGWPQTALHEAIGGKRVDVVRLLLSRGARLDVRDNWGKTALDRARARGQPEILELCEEKSRTEGTDST
jgi:Ankyrin repeats (3 copies)